MNRLIFSLLVLFTSLSLPQSCSFNLDSLSLKDNSFHHFYSLQDKTLQSFPVNRINNITAFYPGVVSYYDNFHIRGGKSNETGFFIDGVKFNDLFSGKNSFLISPNAIEEIEYTPGFIPADYGNATSGLFNYRLKTGGEKFQMNVEQLTDNITFTNDPYSGKKRLGAYYYGYNEFNINAGGPLYLPNVRYFVNANYLFQRDKNPQRYPGVNETFADPYGDIITINLPAGIVPNNYSESFNLVSTIMFDIDRIKISASAIYFNENEYAGRNHILNYLSRNSLVKKDGGIFNIYIEDRINDLISFSINGNYYYKKEKTSDQYLGDNYWAYGDSVANAKAGIYWERDIPGYWGRYLLPRYLRVYDNNFINSSSPITNFEKNEQKNFSVKGIINLSFRTHSLRAGGEISESILRNWSATGRLWGESGQSYFARWLAYYEIRPEFSGYSERQLKEYVLKWESINNFGYDLLGDKADNGLYEPPKPTVFSLFIDDRFNPFENLDIYLGLRYDRYAYNYKTPANPEWPEETYDRQTGNINESGLKPTKSYSYISPKIYLRHNVLNNLSYFINYSRNIQHQAFSDLFVGPGYFNYGFTAHLDVPFIFKTALLQPVVSSIFETGLNYYLPGGVKVQLSVYNKLIKNQPSIELQKTSIYSTYSEYYYSGSNGSTDIKGFEVMLDYNFNGIKILSSLSFEDGRENYYSINRYELNPASADIPLLNSNKISFKTLFEYDFGHVQKISGIFQNMNLAIQFLYNSGHPYIKTGEGTSDVLFAGTGITPSVSQVDIKLEKDVTFFDNLNLSLYVYVINLFDAKNIYEVFSSTGSAEEDYITRHKELYYPDNFRDADKMLRLYRLINIDYNPNNGQQTMYGPPRQIGIGIKLKI